nr:uncharacterized protein LOC109190361 [Ipomoea trifida]
MLYWGDDKAVETCKVCHTSRWKQPKGKNDGDVRCGSKFKKKPSKVLRYFPLKPRLQRLFMSSKTAEYMRWHAMASNKDGLMRHPRDSESWKQFNEVHAEFAADPRNVRLGYPMKEASTNLHKGVENNTHPLVIMLMDNLLHDYYNIFSWRQLFDCCTSNVESSRLVEELQGINM